jgi:phospholipid/cholesterol/gamma-HCH transport system substrate-binding protein
MARITQAAKVGVFVVAASAGLYFVWRTVSKQVEGGGGYVVHAYLDDASGLATHSRVTIAGIPVGQIESIRLENGKARVDVRIRGDVPLYRDATLGKKSASLLGEYTVVLTEGTKEPKLKDGDEVQVVGEDGSLDEIKKNVNDVAKLVKKVAEQLANSVGTEQGGENMRRILQNLADATEALNNTIRENRALIHSTLQHVDSITANGEPRIAEILENVRTITGEIKLLVAQAPDGKGGDVKETLERLNRSSKSLESALAHVDRIAERIDNGEGTIGRLTKDDTLVREAESAVEGINDFIGPISRMQTIVGLRSDYNFLSNTLKSYVELRLQPREDKYYSLEFINDPRGKTTITQTDVDTTNPNDPPHYRVVTTTTTDSFRFSLQFARRLGPFTGRFGIKESTGGVGLDMHLFNDRVEVISDLFGFAEEIVPRYRVALSYQFINRLWLLGGLDHLFLSTRRDYFIGLSLRFNDEDLKSVLPFAGSSAGGAAR